MTDRKDVNLFLPSNAHLSCLIRLIEGVTSPLTSRLPRTGGEQWSQGTLWVERIRYALDRKNNKWASEDNLEYFERSLGPQLKIFRAPFAPDTRRLGQTCEDGAKRQIFAIGNYVNQMLLKPVHDWAMEVLSTLSTDDTFNQTKPLDRLVGKSTLFSFDLKSATDRWPLVILFEMICFLFDRSFASAAPLFALSHHLVVWYYAERVRPSLHFTDYAVLGDDVIIANKDVATMYRRVLKELGVTISEQKSLISDSGCGEFAKRFRVRNMSIDLSPVSIRALKNFYNPYGLYAVMEKYSIKRFSTLCRIGGLGYRGTVMVPKDLKIAPKELMLSPLAADFTEYSILRNWVSQWLQYVKWYWVIAMQPDMSLEAFFDAPVVEKSWKITRKDEDVAAASSSLDLINGLGLPLSNYKKSPHIEADPHNGHPWYSDIKTNLESQAFPKDATANDRRTLQRLAAQYVINRGILYKCSFSSVIGIHSGPGTPRICMQNEPTGVLINRATRFENKLVPFLMDGITRSTSATVVLVLGSGISGRCIYWRALDVSVELVCSCAYWVVRRYVPLHSVLAPHSRLQLGGTIRINVPMARVIQKLRLKGFLETSWRERRRIGHDAYTLTSRAYSCSAMSLVCAYPREDRPHQRSTIPFNQYEPPAPWGTSPIKRKLDGLKLVRIHTELNGTTYLLPISKGRRRRYSGLTARSALSGFNGKVTGFDSLDVFTTIVGPSLRGAQPSVLRVQSVPNCRGKHPILPAQIKTSNRESFMEPPHPSNSWCTPGGGKSLNMGGSNIDEDDRKESESCAQPSPKLRPIYWKKDSGYRMTSLTDHRARKTLYAAFQVGKLYKRVIKLDGSRILGLGDLGLHGIGIAIGKLDLYVVAVGINPQREAINLPALSSNSELVEAKLSWIVHIIAAILKTKQFSGVRAIAIEILKFSLSLPISKLHRRHHRLLRSHGGLTFMSTAAAPFGVKSNVLKAQKNGGLGGRKPESPLWYLEMEEMFELEYEDQSQWKKPSVQSPCGKAINLAEDDVSHDAYVDLERPLGRKDEKERLNKRKSKDSAGSNYAGILNGIMEDKKKANDKKMEILEKACLQEQEQNRINQELEQERIRIMKEEIQERFRIKQEKIRAEQLKEEERIIMMDTNGLSPMQQQYYLHRQMEILESQRSTK
ncbi:hypothetical protein HYC85_004431 [Camellia sinensis]|uniref:Malic enzyme N-terminal domain-containing protein n=1 Tax=Camellia sinensis TaxID=4442 RepID=A0A7J7HYK7_CAMSI|nr:hypothetical protein HYC85_004431 [Camellia sinensis]